MKRFFVIYAVLLAGGASALGYTNLLENGTNIMIDTAWDAGGDMIVGDITPSNTLTISVGGSLTNVDAYVGAQASASNNTVSVSGTDAEWINTGTLQVGVAGNSNNTVTVTGGGTIAASNLVVVAGNDFNLNNNGTLNLTEGFDVSTNGFNWNAGGILSVGGKLTGLATTNGGIHLSGEKTLVLNGGSLTTSTNLIVGYESSGNTLAITNGATVSNADGYIGWGTDSANNSVLVSDAGSAWTNRGNLYVGVYGDTTNLLTAGANNTLTVTNEGWVFVGESATNLAGAGSGGIAVGNSSGMVVGESATVLADGLYIDASGDFDLYGSLRITGGFDAEQAGFNWEHGGTLTVNGALAFDQALGGTNKTLNIDGGSWDRGGDLQINGAGNKLSILSGGTVTNNNAYVIGSSNSVTVSGTDSEWVNNGTLNITNGGNSVTVASGGRVAADELNIAAGNDFNLNNGGTLAMTGDFDVSLQTNLNWNQGGNLSVGGWLEGMAVATNLPTANAAYLAGGRDLTLDGGQWLAGDSNVVIGLNADLGSALVITNGGSVDNADGYIGWGSVSDNNSVWVGAGSAWTNHGGGLYVGKWLDANTNLVDAATAANNRLTVQSNGWVFVGEGRTNGPGGGLVVASTNGAELVIAGNGSSVTVEQTLYLGVDDATTGSVVVANGGALSVGDLAVASNSMFDLYGSFSIATNFNASQDGFTWYDGAALSVGGELTGLDALDGTNRTLVIAGEWDTTATNLYITGAGNTITNEGTIYSASAYIGLTSNDVDNTVLVSGSGSEWNLTGSLFVNSSNTLQLASTGLVSIAGNMTVSNATVAGSGTVRFGDGTNVFSVYGADSSISAGVLFDGSNGVDTVAFTDSELLVVDALTNRFINFENLNMTNSLLGGNGTVDVFTDIDMIGGSIVPDGELVIDGAFKASNTLLQLTAGADTIVFTTNSPALNLSGLLAEITISNSASPVAFNEQILTATNGLSAEFTSTNFIEHFLLWDFDLSDDGTNIFVQSEAAQDGTIGASVEYGGIQGVRAGFNGMQNAAFVRTKQLRRNAVATDNTVSHKAYLLLPEEENEPTGPQGPDDRNTIFGMHFWAEQFSGQGDYDAIGPSDGYTLNNNGTTFGFDRLFGDSLAVGINYTYARSAARMNEGDRMDTETYWLGLYGEWFGKNDYYLEGLLAFGWSDYDSVRIDGLYEGVGEFEGDDFGGHLEAGKYFHRNNWAMAPYIGMNYLGIKSDSYTENDLSGGLPVRVSGQDIASCESVLGMKLRNRIDTKAGRFQAVGYAEWAYDFINDDIGSTLSDGTVSVETARVAPGETLFNVGAGFSWICTDSLEIGVGYDGRFNEDFEEHMGSAMFDIRF